MFGSVLLKKFGIGVKFVYTDDPADFAAAIDSKTKAVYIESIGNPKYNVPNISLISKVRKRQRFVVSLSDSHVKRLPMLKISL